MEPNAMNRTLTFSQPAARSRTATFEELAQKHYRQAYNIAYRISGSSTDAEDLTQEALIRAYQSFERYQPELPFANWLYRIISNLHVDELRRRGRARVESIDASAALTDIPDSTYDTADRLLSRELDGYLQHALDALSPDFRTAIVLCDIEGLSYEEIAEIMGCSIGTVRSRVHRGRKQMRKLLGVT
jgi:RNA polymerase sigma-70 factor (ECF subfamily)